VFLKGVSPDEASMQCTSCKAEVAKEAKECAACGTKVRRTRKRAAEAADTPLTQEADLGSRPTQWAYRCAVYGLIPLVGLVLGPVAVVLALLGYRQDRTTAGKGRVALAVLALGAAVLLTNWVGVALMVFGLWGNG
jgi:hypothetical protein